MRSQFLAALALLALGGFTSCGSSTGAGDGSGQGGVGALGTGGGGNGRARGKGGSGGLGGAGFGGVAGKRRAGRLVDRVVSLAMRRSVARLALPAAVVVVPWAAPEASRDLAAAPTPVSRERPTASPGPSTQRGRRRAVRRSRPHVR